jgi:hypothetical protein
MRSERVAPREKGAIDLWRRAKAFEEEKKEKA